MEIRVGSRHWVLILGAVSFSTLLIVSACSSGNAAKAKAGSPSEKEPAVPVQVFTVKSRGVRRTVEAVGSLFAYDEVVVSSEVDGRAEKVLVDVGDHVTQGQALVEILPTEFKLAADQQEAMLEQARAKLGSTDGDAEIKDPTQTAAVKKAAADLANAKQKYERTKAIAEKGLVRREKLEGDESKYKAVQATYELAVQDVRNLQAFVKQERVLRDLANKKLRDTNILAPFAGSVKERNVTVGQYLKVQTPVMTIVNVDPMRVRLKVPEKMAAWVPVGQMVTLSVEAYPDRTFSGRVSRINPSVDPQTRTFDAHALIDNRQQLLKPAVLVKPNTPSARLHRG